MNKSILVGLIVAIVIAVGAGIWIGRDELGIGASAPNSELDVSEPAPAVPDVKEDDKILGKADAPVTIVEYFSLGCIHCKNFHETILPKLKTDYIDTGKVRLVFRDFPLDGISFGAALVTRCVNDLAYFAMVDTLFKQQETWHVDNGMGQLANIVKGAGMDQAALDACLNNQANKDKIVALQKEGSDTLKINSTPTFFINDRVLAGVSEYEAFKATIDGALARAQ
jgi:protein-disulfide isomerase